MKNFAYLDAPDVKTALQLLEKEKGQACLVAGTTNVMVDIRNGKLRDKTFINIRGIEALRGIKNSRGKIVIGPLTTISDLAQSDLLKQKAPVLYAAANVFADPTTRNSATIAGNIANASPAADTAPPLLALQADIVIEKKGSKRVVAAEDFFLGVNKTALQPDEMITAIEFAPCPTSAFYKLGLRNAMAISVSSVACCLKKGKDGVVSECTIALGSVAPKPVRAIQAEKALIGKKLDEAALEAAAKALAKDISPIDDVRASGEYRKGVSPVLLKRVVLLAAGETEGRNK